jgi:hypothetical protein
MPYLADALFGRCPIWPMPDAHGDQCPMPTETNAQCPMPYALCPVWPMPNAQCPMPYALCPIPYARRVPHVTLERLYLSLFVKWNFDCKGSA